MRKLYLLVLLFLGIVNSSVAQPLKFYPTQPQVFGKSILYPFTGGFQAAFAQPFDLNNDGIKDLILFDRVGLKPLTFLDTGNVNHAYIYAPQYEPYFNFMTSWFLVRDFNRDGKDDLFVGKYGNVDVYKNISTGKVPKFQLLYETLTDTELINQSIPDLRSNIYVESSGLPVFDDIDGDGDIDAISLNILSTYFDFYKNMQVEANLPKDSIALIRWKACWGSMGVSFVRNDADIGSTCENIFRHSSAHFGSTICMFDENGDGDMDLVHGDVGFNNLALFKNGKKDLNYMSDTIIATDTLFPSYNKPVDISVWPAAAYFDIDKDGLKDLYIGANESKVSRNVRVKAWYKNKGSNSAPKFEFVTDNFLGDITLDIGKACAPAFYDYDGDKDNDLIIATGWDRLQSNDTDYVLYLYKNEGTDTLPKYILADTNWLDLRSHHIFPAVPAFGDLNGDGKADLLIGNQNGRLYYFENNGTTFQYVTDFFDSIDVGLYSHPAIGDLNKDGKNDIIIGHLYGNIYYYENTGNTTGKKFELKTDSLGKIYTNHDYFDTNDSIWYTESEGLSAPCLADINKDGKLDLLTGSLHGNLGLYFNIVDYIYSKAPKTDSFCYSLTTDTFEGIFVGKNIIPSVNTIDGDTMPDIVIGNQRGGLNFYGTRRTAPRLYNTGFSVFESRLPVSHIHIYPNPANSFLQVSYSGGEPIQSYQIINQLGQVIKVGNIPSNLSSIDISLLTPGYYILKLEGKEAYYLNFIKHE